MDVQHEQSQASEEWYTPPHIVEALGEFDLDPCAAPLGVREHALVNFREEDDGLNRSWVLTDYNERVWLNPPYGRSTGAWLKKMAGHGNGIALIFARTDTQAFFDHVWGQATGIFFLKGRVRFLAKRNGLVREQGQSGAPSVLVAYDHLDVWENANALKNCGLPGYFVDLTPTEVVWSGWACAIKNILQFGSLTLQELYTWVERSVHRPENNHIRAKIRQILNDRNAELFCKTGEGVDARWSLQRWER